MTEEEDQFDFAFAREIRLREIRDYLEESYLPYKMLSVGEMLKLVQFAHYPIKEYCPDCKEESYLRLSGFCWKCEDKEDNL